MESSFVQPQLHAFVQTVVVGWVGLMGGGVLVGGWVLVGLVDRGG